MSSIRRTSLIWISVATVLAIVEVMVLPRTWPGAARPSLTFVLVAALAIRAADRRRGHDGDLLVLCWAIGLIKDLFSNGPMGGNAFIFVSVAAAFIGVRRAFFVWSPLVWGGTGFLLFFAGHLLEGVAVGLVRGGIPAGRMIGLSIAAAMAETALLPLTLLAFRHFRVALRGT